MPFGAITMSEQRKSLIEEIKAGELDISNLCRKYGISRPTAYKWLERSKTDISFEEHSRMPLYSPNKTIKFIEDLIIQTRIAHPFWGGRKLKVYLERKGETNIPSASTITAILKRNCLISKETNLTSVPYKRFEHEKPNDLWQCDFKGNFLMENGNRCFPLTVTDDMSRYNLCISAKSNEQLTGVWNSFISLFEERGLPNMILCDNGNPWGSNFKYGFTRFEVLLMNYGILPIHGKPLHPQTQGKEERFHRTLKTELLNNISIKDLEHAQKEFDLFRMIYNEDRPHCSLQYKVPADRYINSERTMPKKIEKWEYPSDYNVQKIKWNGYIVVKDKVIFLSNAFLGLNLALVESEEDGFIDIIYRNFRIAVIDIKNQYLITKKITKLK